MAAFFYGPSDLMEQGADVSLPNLLRSPDCRGVSGRY